MDPDNRNPEGLLALLKPYPSEEMTVFPVDPGSLSGIERKPSSLMGF
jgi:hypothetical protein